MSDNSINPLAMMATAPLSTTTKPKSGSWYEAMATAWGDTLDAKANELEATAGQISGGDDKPATITQLSTQAMQMGFLSTSSHTAITSAGEALKTMAQKS